MSESRCESPCRTVGRGIGKGQRPRSGKGSGRRGRHGNDLNGLQNRAGVSARCPSKGDRNDSSARGNTINYLVVRRVGTHLSVNVQVRHNGRSVDGHFENSIPRREVARIGLGEFQSDLVTSGGNVERIAETSSETLGVIKGRIRGARDSSPAGDGGPAAEILIGGPKITQGIGIGRPSRIHPPGGLHNRRWGLRRRRGRDRRTAVVNTHKGSDARPGEIIGKRIARNCHGPLLNQVVAPIGHPGNHRGDVEAVQVEGLAGGGCVAIDGHDDDGGRGRVIGVLISSQGNAARGNRGRPHAVETRPHELAVVA